MEPNELNYRFDDFVLDVSNRQLWHGETRIDLNARYFDALVLLVREHGQLIEKDRFFEEVWGDVVVSDSALTQCIKDIRKQLGDDAANPRYIQTVPRHGYRFTGNVETLDSIDVLTGGVREEGELPVGNRFIDVAERATEWSAFGSVLILGGAGTLGGGIAGVIGGLIYGFGLAYPAQESGLGTVSILVVLITLTAIIGIAGGFGVSFGMAIARLVERHFSGLIIIGAATGGMLVGGLTKLLGVDAFNLLFGQAPAGITGGVEGAALGAAVALGAQLGGGLNARTRWWPAVGAGIACATAGVLIPLAGGRLMGGSLELLARSFSGSRLRLDALGRFFGELHFGHTSQVILGGIEGLLFGSCVVGAIILVQFAWSSHSKK